MKIDLISERYKNDGVSLMPLNNIQQRYVELFINDGRIKYEDVTSCLLCGANDFTIIAEKERYGIPLKTGVCAKCGLILSLDKMTPESLSIFYLEYYRKIYEGIERPAIDYYKSLYNSELSKGRIQGFLKSDSVVVELGTAGGWNLLPYKKAGIKYFGFDLDRDLIDLGKHEYGLNLYCGSINDAINMGIKADFVFFNHVLEHCYNPIEMLTQVKRLLKENGLLQIIVPSANLLIYGGGGTGYDLLGTLQNAHNFLFDDFTMLILGKIAGYDLYSFTGETFLFINRENDYNNIIFSENRGQKVINYLKLCEKLVPLKNIFFRNTKLSLKLHYIQYLFNPIRTFKTYLSIKKGIIF